MLSGELVTLRPVRVDDLPALYETWRDPSTWIAVSDAALWPMPFAVFEQRYAKYAADEELEFAIEVAGELVGRCSLYQVDLHSRHADLGITVGHPYRGKGYGRDAVGVLLDYAFNKRNLHRVQLEVLATNDGAINSYVANGFVEEGRLREHAYVNGTFVDVVAMSVLRTEWLGSRGGR